VDAIAARMEQQRARSGLFIPSWGSPEEPSGLVAEEDEQGPLQEEAGL